MQTLFIDHSLLAISLNTTSKVESQGSAHGQGRVPGRHRGKLPPRLTAGFAALRDVLPGECLREKFWWPIIGERRSIGSANDMEVLRFFEAHKSDSPVELAGAVCRTKLLAGSDRNSGFLGTGNRISALFEREASTAFELLGN